MNYRYFLVISTLAIVLVLSGCHHHSSAPTASYSIGGSVSGLASGAWVVLLNNGGNNLTVSQNGAFAFGNTVASGASYAVTIGQQPIGQTCTVSQGSDSVVVSNVTNIQVSCSNNAPTTHTVGGTLSGLAAGQSITLQDNGGDDLTVSANGNFTFATPVSVGAPYAVTVSTSPHKQQCSVVGGSGAMGSRAVTTVAVQCVSNLGVAYVADANNNAVWQFAINPTGTLSAMTPASVPAGNYPVAVAVSPNRQYAYAANLGDGTVSQFTVDADGQLTPMTPSSSVGTGTSSQPYSIAVTPNGQFAYAVVAGNTGYIAEYSVGGTGALTPLSPATVSAGHNPQPIAIAPNGKYAYVGNWNDGTVSQFQIGANGQLSPLSPATVATGTMPQGLAMTPSGAYLYVANYGAGNPGGNNVSQFQVNADGTLTALSPATVAGSGGTACPANLVVDPTGHFLYVANNCESTVAQYSIGGNGTLSALSPATVTKSSSAVGIAMDPTGKFLYSGNGGDLAQFGLGAGGLLAPLTPPTVTLVSGSYPYSITTTP